MVNLTLRDPYPSIDACVGAVVRRFNGLNVPLDELSSFSTKVKQDIMQEVEANGFPPLKNLTVKGTISDSGLFCLQARWENV